jgi:diguanylate cyclase (GGDEF)-like protein
MTAIATLRAKSQTAARTPAEMSRGTPWMSGLRIDATQQLQLQTALAKLAEAEEKLAEQQDRIAYLESLTMTDELTGLLNRRGFNAQFRRVLAAARRHGGTDGGLMVMIDLDGFKAINDTHGHLAGDAYLRHVARFLAGRVREHDVVARLGGDEFAILLTGTDTETGEVRARELADAANEAVMSWDGTILPIRFSVGTHPYSDGMNEDDVMRMADVQMYKHKAARRQARAVG